MSTATPTSRFNHWAKRFHIGLHYVLPFLLAGIGAKLFLSVHEINAGLCYRENADLPDVWLFVAGFSGALCGRGISWLGNRENPDEGEERIHRTQGSYAAGQLVLAIAFFLVVVLLVIEALGTVRLPVRETTLEPMTYYIRCAIISGKAATGGFALTASVIFVVYFCIGHWLWGWHPRGIERMQRLGLQ